MNDETFWLDARKQICMDPAKVNLNAGTLSPTPKPVLKAVTELRQRMAENPSDFCWRQLPVLIEHSRRRLSEYLHCDPLNLLLIPNVTFAINMVVSSLKSDRGSEILTTDHEYGAMMYAWQRQADRNGWKISSLELPHRTEDPNEIVRAFERAITPATRAIFFSHVTTITGLRLPVRDLCTLARRRGLLSIVDGAHAPGMVPVDLSDIGADFYGANCHKWLMAPAGAGFLHVSPSHKREMSPLITSWGYEYDREEMDADSHWGGSFWQRDLEFHGTLDRTPQMVLPEALDFRTTLGGDDAIIKRTRYLSDYATQRLAACGLARVTPLNNQLNGGALTAFDFPCQDVLAWRDWIWNKHHIECPITTAARKTFLRVSTGWFNTIKEIDRLVEAIRAFQSSG
ncbi:MAG TPA: aminotransferase class V-fold PLP-dependent enzyme [Tepidisphaeraceae bacterium]|nr:aminotransferase class V-fold PLP-dependent enzyme [Tepidisphaeraceae bacterium]